MADHERNEKRSKPFRPSVVSSGVKGYVQNLALIDRHGNDDRATFAFFFRPTTVNQSLSVKYRQTQPIGMSHGYHGYIGTENERWNFELYANAMLVGAPNHETGKGSTGRPSSMKHATDFLENGRRFLQALCYPAATTKGVVGAEPPPAILCIPHVVTERVRLVTLNFTHQIFAEDGRIMEWRCQTSWEEAPQSRLEMQDVLDNGSFRTWG